jgi:hypothetical protein
MSQSVRFQAYYKGQKLGNPRTEKQKNQVEFCCSDILWAVIKEPNEREVRG